MIKKSFGAVAAVSLGLTLFTGGVASAVEKPIAGTTACTDRVESSTEVNTARANLNTARVTLQETEADVDATSAQRLAAQQDVERRVALLSIARQNQTGLLCRTTTVTPAPTTTAVTPPRTIVQQPTTVVERPTVIDRERISTVAVVPTRDDGSTATVSGGQVTVVPEGSASTGQA